MQIKHIIKKNILYKFIMLAPYNSLFIFIGSIISGLLQSAVVLSTIPLMYYLGMTGDESQHISFIKIYDSIFETIGLDNSLFTVIIFMVLFQVGEAFIRYGIEVYSALVSAKVISDLRKEVISVTLEAKWQYFVTKRIGGVINTVIEEVRRSVNGYKDTIIFLSNIVRGTILISISFIVSPIISIGAIIVGIIFIVVFQKWITYAKDVGKKFNDSLIIIKSRLTDVLYGLKPLKAMNNDNFLLPILTKETTKLQELYYRGFVVSKLPWTFRQAFVFIIIGLGLYFSVSYSLIPNVSLIALMLLFNRTLESFGAAQSGYQTIKSMEPFFMSLRKNVVQARDMKENWKGVITPVFNHTITADKLFFSYSNDSILSDVNFTIFKNSFVVIIGKSGSGKTTICDILCGLYEPNQGAIFIDNNNLNSLDINKWRKMIGYVPQDLILFHESIKENITLGDSTITNEEVINALNDAGVWDYISDLPEGIETVIGERGIRLSGGQRQRLSIARAIIRKPKLVILDEATTALDPKTEQRILSTMKKLTDKGITVVAVSHQRAVLEIADKVYELEKEKFREIKI